MGMDVYGKKPENEIGRYFRRNVWGWHPLWGYVEDNHPEIAELVANAHTNDGDGLNATQSKLLAQLMKEDLATGRADKYISERNEMLAKLPRTECDLCKGTGTRKDKIAVEHGMDKQELTPEQALKLGRTKGYCNACHGEGTREAWETNYSVDLDDLEEFSDFLQVCGGFEIC